MAGCALSFCEPYALAEVGDGRVSKQITLRLSHPAFSAGVEGNPLTAGSRPFFFR